MIFLDSKCDVYQTQWVICSFSHSSLVETSSEHLHSQTVRARKLKFWEKINLLLPVMCHMSCVTCHVSCVMCHVSLVQCHMSCVTKRKEKKEKRKKYKVVKLVGEGSVINGDTPSSLPNKCGYVIYKILHVQFHMSNLKQLMWLDEISWNETYKILQGKSLVFEINE